jgi:hypothetical protein
MSCPFLDSPHVRKRTSPLSSRREGQSERCELGVSQQNNESEMQHYFILLTYSSAAAPRYIGLFTFFAVEKK